MEIIILVWIHFIADFILQSNKMSLNKSSSLKYLGYHCSVYALPFLFFGFDFALIACGSHFIIDFFSSKVTHYLWEKEEVHWFFVTIGFDQALHLTSLILMLKYL